MRLRDYQEQAIEALREAMRGGARAPLLVSPTGSGKSLMLTAMAKGAHAKGRRVMVTAPRREIVQQLSATFSALDLPHAILAPGHPPPTAGVRVASLQALASRIKRLQEPGLTAHEQAQRAAAVGKWDLLVLDEAHHAAAADWLLVVRHCPDAIVLGVTATPCRADGKGLGDVFDRMVLGPSVRRLQELGHLCRADVWAPSAPDLTGLRTIGGDWSASALGERVAKLTGDVIDHLRRLGRPPAVAFACTLQHADQLAGAFRDAGYSAATISGGMARDKRGEIVRALAGGALEVMASVDVVSEGFDCPDVATGILARPTQSLSLYLQQIGRVLRPTDGKQRAVVLDHAGNCLRHGLPDMDRAWSLEGGAARGASSGPGLRTCLACYAIAEAGPAECPYCGTPYPRQEREPIAVADGELRKVEAAALEAAKAERRRIEREHAPKCKTLADWQALARLLGHPPGWGWHRWQARGAPRAAPALAPTPWAADDFPTDWLVRP